MDEVRWPPLDRPAPVLSRAKAIAIGCAVAVAFLVLSAAHLRGKTVSGPTYNARPPVTVAVEEPATLVPLTLAPPTPERDELFGEQMMRFGIVLGRGSREELAKPEAALTGAAMESALGPGPAASMRHFVEVAKESANAPPLDQASVTALDRAIARLDNSLLAAKLPYFVDAVVMTDPRANDGRGRRIMTLFEFSVASSNLYLSDDGAFVRSVRVRRLDHLNQKHTSLGFVNPERAQATILLDIVDEQVVRHLVPALVEGAPMPLVPNAQTGLPTPLDLAMHDVATDAGAHARAELGGLAYEGLRDAFADSIERHEVQHRIDLKHAAEAGPLPIPPAVSALIRGTSRGADDMRESVTSELSAYLAQIAREERMPRTTLALLLRFLVNPRTRTSTEAHVARVAAEELCRTLAIAGITPLVHDGRLDERRLALAHRALTSVPPADLTKAAATVWADLFGRPLATIRRLP